MQATPRSLLTGRSRVTGLIACALLAATPLLAAPGAAAPVTAGPAPSPPAPAPAVPVAVPAAVSVAVPAAPRVAVPTVVRADSPGLVWLGRWDVTSARAVTVNSGSRVLLAFSGPRVTVLFDRRGITAPPQVYTSLDGGPAVVHAVTTDRLVLTAPSPGIRHVLELAVKDVDQRAPRWSTPLRSAVAVRGFALAAGGRLLAPPAVGTRRILFLGDSITQGVRLLGRDRGPNGSDGTRAYPALVASAFRASYQQVGFGGQGVLIGGGGGVPAAEATLGSVHAGAAADPRFRPDVVVVNQGTNDRTASPQAFRSAYRAYLSAIRQMYPGATVLAMRPLSGRHAGEVAAAVRALEDPAVLDVDTAGWLVPGAHYSDGVHPTAAGHVLVATRLSRLLAARTGWSLSPVRWTATAPPPVTTPPPGIRPVGVAPQ